MQLQPLTPWGFRISLSLALVYAANGILRRFLLDLPGSKSRRTSPTGEPAYGGLESLVSFSACLIAARRALETEQPEPYIVDLLAAGLCGKEALEARRAVNKADEATATAPPPPPPPPPLATSTDATGNAITATETPLGEAAPSPQPQPHAPQRPIERLIMRTKFFDDVVSVVTWRGEGPSAAPASYCCHTQLLAACQRAAPCLQVVLLGSGLDARPWRLPLPPGVRWFEVDRHDVLAAKQQRLRALGAQLTAPESTPTASAAAAAAVPAAHLRGVISGHAGGGATVVAVRVPSGGTAGREEEGAGRPEDVDVVKHPLQAACWRVCAVDLARSGWSRGLVKQGLGRAAPVLWVLEGLLYYLEEADVRALLREAASVSGRGSILAASVIQAKKPTAVAAPSVEAAATADTTPSMPVAAAAAEGPVKETTVVASETLASVTRPGKKEGGGGGGGTGGGAGDGVSQAREGDSGRSAGPETRRARYNLNSEFKWRCEGEVSEFINSCGWNTLSSLAWTDVADSYGLSTLERTSGVYFVTASRE